MGRRAKPWKKSSSWKRKIELQIWWTPPRLSLAMRNAWKLQSIAKIRRPGWIWTDEEGWKCWEFRWELGAHIRFNLKPEGIQSISELKIKLKSGQLVAGFIADTESNRHMGDEIGWVHGKAHRWAMEGKQTGCWRERIPGESPASQVAGWKGGQEGHQLGGPVPSWRA